MSSGGIRVSPRELRWEIQADLKVANKIGQSPLVKNNTIMSKVTPDIFEKLDKIRKGR